MKIRAVKLYRNILAFLSFYKIPKLAVKTIIAKLLRLWTSLIKEPYNPMH